MSYVGNAPAGGIISGENIQDGGIQTVDIANLAVTPAKLSTGAPIWDASGNLGIGISSPEASLQNNGANGRFIISAGNAPSSGATTNKWRISLREVAEGDFSLQHYNGTSYDTPFYINAGNVGIGTTSPTSKLEVQQGTKAATASVISSARFTTTDASAFGLYFRQKTDATAANRWTGILSFDNGVGATPLVLQDLGGNVGIGTTAPATTLDVVGQGRFAVAGGSAQIKLERTGNSVGASWIGADGSNALKVFDTSFNSIFTITSAGNAVLAGGNVSANGVGVTFPATQSQSSDANTLDDYEEGTWTPVISGTSSNPTYTVTVVQGKYTKVGNLVYVYGYIYVSGSVTGGSGNLQISGFPFISNNQTSYGYPNLNAGYNALAGVYGSGVTRVQMLQSQTNATYYSAPNTGVTLPLGSGGFELSFNGCYATN